MFQVSPPRRVAYFGQSKRFQNSTTSPIERVNEPPEPRLHIHEWRKRKANAREHQRCPRDCGNEWRLDESARYGLEASDHIAYAIHRPTVPSFRIAIRLLDKAVIAEKGYDLNAFVQAVRSNGAKVFPPRS